MRYTSVAHIHEIIPKHLSDEIWSRSADAIWSNYSEVWKQRPAAEVLMLIKDMKIRLVAFRRMWPNLALEVEHHFRISMLETLIPVYKAVCHDDFIDQIMSEAKELYPMIDTENIYVLECFDIASAREYVASGEYLKLPVQARYVVSAAAEFRGDILHMLRYVSTAHTHAQWGEFKSDADCKNTDILHTALNNCIIETLNGK